MTSLLWADEGVVNKVRIDHMRTLLYKEKHPLVDVFFIESVEYSLYGYG